MGYMKWKKSKLYEKSTKLTGHKHKFFFKHKWELTEKEGEKQIQQKFFSKQLFGPRRFRQLSVQWGIHRHSSSVKE